MTHALCPFGDPFCPCQDGMICHYVDAPGSPAMSPPTEAEKAAWARAAQQIGIVWGEPEPECPD